jgi:hypothetical protein
MAPECIMISHPYGRPMSPAEPIASLQATGRTSGAGSQLTPTPEESHQAWRFQLGNLQECICELLIKNQQLRMALRELKATLSDDVDGYGVWKNSPGR